MTRPSWPDTAHWLLEPTIPVKVVSERLGHANIAHTMQTYQHVLPGMQADAADTTERLANPQPKANDLTSTEAGTRKKKTSTKATRSKKPKTQKAAKPPRKTPVERRGNNRRNAA